MFPCISLRRPVVLLVLLAAGGILSVSDAPAQNPKNYDLFYKANRIYTVEPAIEIVVNLTPDQKSRLDAARQVLEEDPEMAAAAEARKSAGEGSDQANAAKQAFDTARKAAEAKYYAVIEETLTDDQKGVILTLQEFASDLHKEADLALDGQGSGPNGNPTWPELMAKIREMGRPRLGEVLTPEQMKLLPAETPKQP